MAIQVFKEHKRPTFGQQFGRAVGAGLEAAAPMVEEYQKEKKQAEQYQQENESVKNLIGKDISGIRDPKIRDHFVRLALEAQNKKEELGYRSQLEKEDVAKEEAAELKDYDIISERFGKKFADLWKLAPTGGKTKLIQTALDATERGYDLEDLLAGVASPMEGAVGEEEEFPEAMGEMEGEAAPKVQMKNGEIPKEFKWPNYSKKPVGYTLKEWNKEKGTWRKENAPIFQKNNQMLESARKDELGITKLTQINESEKLPEGFERFLINPMTGDFYGIAQLAQIPSPEAQEWVKEIARFQNRAKEAFGARVTNFDLVSYMRQFPGLLNSPEGRRRILNMMRINNQLDQLYSKALKQVYRKYGMSNIPQERAEELAQNLIEDETQQLRDEYLGLDEENNASFGQKGMAGGTEVGMQGPMENEVEVLGPNGEEGFISQEDARNLPAGWKIR